MLKIIYIDKDDVFLEWYYVVEWEEDGSYFVWYSEWDGWCYFYCIFCDGSDIVDFILGDYDIVDLIMLNEVINSFYFIVVFEYFEQCFLFKGLLDGSQFVECVIFVLFVGNNSYYMLKDVSYVMYIYSWFNQLLVS